VRVGVVDSWEVMEGDRPALKAPRQLIVRGMPLKEMHLRPISRINSAAARGDKGVVSGGGLVVATSWRISRDAGELRVNVAAAWMLVSKVIPRKMGDSKTYRESDPRPLTIPALAGLAGDAGVDVADLARGRGLARAGKRRVDERLERR